MCWVGLPPVPDLAQPLHRTLSQVQLKTGFTATSLLSLRQCHLQQPLLSCKPKWIFGLTIAYIALDCTKRIHNTQNIFNSLSSSLPFLWNSLWAQECRGCETAGAVQCRHQPSLQSRMDRSPRGCLPKWPGDHRHPCERGCQDWVSKCLRDHLLICGSWEWAVGSFEISCKMWWVQLYMHLFI